MFNVGKRRMRTVVKVCSSMIFLLSVSAMGYAQGPIQAGGNVFQTQKPNVSLRSMSLLDPSRFTMRQQSVFSYSSSGMSGSNLMGMYINTMEYRFNMPLTMRLKVAYQNNMGSLFGKTSFTGGQPGVDTGRMFVPSFDLVYQPWKNTSISFHYRDFSGMTEDSYGYSPWGGYRYSDPFGLYR